MSITHRWENILSTKKPYIQECKKKGNNILSSKSDITCTSRLASSIYDISFYHKLRFKPECTIKSGKKKLQEMASVFFKTARFVRLKLNHKRVLILHVWNNCLALSHWDTRWKIAAKATCRNKVNKCKDDRWCCQDLRPRPRCHILTECKDDRWRCRFL